MVNKSMEEKMNNIAFLNHYRKFLGTGVGLDKEIISCLIRDEIFCFNSKYPLIFSKFNEKNYVSIAPEFKDKFEANLNISEFDLCLDNLLPIIDDAFCDLADEYWIQKMFRMTVSESDLIKPEHSDLVQNFSEKHKEMYLRNLGNRGDKYKTKKWQFMQQLRDEGRYFVIIDKDQIASFAYISDIQAGGGNIVVMTKPNFRQKGYGKALVYTATNWCFKNKLIPIYLVSQSNQASINLAKSLGFETMVEEIVVTVKN